MRRVKEFIAPTIPGALPARHAPVRRQSSAQRRLRRCKGLLKRAGGIDYIPIERPDFMAFLLNGNRSICIGRIMHASSNACEARREVGGEKRPRNLVPVACAAAAI